MQLGEQLRRMLGFVDHATLRELAQKLGGAGAREFAFKRIGNAVGNGPFAANPFHSIEVELG